MDRDFPYLKFMEISKKCREKIVYDTLNNNSVDLYDALYSEVSSEVFNIKMELYELKWIELHWEMVSDSIEKKELTNTEKKELISMFAKWYKQFVSDWNYSDLDVFIFEDKMNILRTLISVNNEWEQNLKKMKVSFIQSKKLLNIRIKELEREV